jgi:hypothetical protein
MASAAIRAKQLSDMIDGETQHFREVTYTLLEMDGSSY